MKFKLIIDKTKEEEVAVTAHERSSLTEQIEALVMQHTGSDRIIAYTEDEMKQLSFANIECITVLDGKTYVIEEKDFDYRADGTYVHFRSINAAQMSEVLYVSVHRDGTQVSNTITYSIESYAYSKQNDANPRLAELVKRMMCYGDSAKAFVGN